jgi:DNA-binding NtrC family response regulator
MASTVLLVEDDHDFGRLMQKALRSISLECVHVCTGEAARQKLREVTYALILLDIDLPDCHGVDLVQECHKSAPHVPIIMLSGHQEPHCIVTAMQNGASDYMVKPIDLKAFLCKVTEILRLNRSRELAETLHTSQQASPVLGNSFAARQLSQQVVRLTQIDVPLLMRGESGTGKSFMSETIHAHSARAGRPFVTVNCPNIPAALLESELFGHVQGAFTGATKSKIGKFEQADTGTLFLDEIGDLMLPLQAKLLRVLQGSEFERLGSVETQHVDVRIIAATNQNLEDAIARGTFREDLYYRINVFPLYIPALRERKEDIPLLVELLCQKYAEQFDKTIAPISPLVMRFLQDYEWPGNIRELENAIKRAIVYSNSPKLQMHDFALGASAMLTKTASQLSSKRSNLYDIKYQAIQQALEDAKGNISAAAKKLGVSRGTIYRRIQKWQQYQQAHTRRPDKE